MILFDNEVEWQSRFCDADHCLYLFKQGVGAVSLLSYFLRHGLHAGRLFVAPEDPVEKTLGLGRFYQAIVAGFSHPRCTVDGFLQSTDTVYQAQGKPQRTTPYPALRNAVDVSDVFFATIGHPGLKIMIDGVYLVLDITPFGGGQRFCYGHYVCFRRRFYTVEGYP